VAVELIALTVFAALTLLTFGVAALVNERRTSTSRRLMVVTGSGAGEARIRQDELGGGGKWRLAAELIEKVGFWSEGKFATDKKEAKTDEGILLSYAGWRSPKAMAFYRGTRLVAALSMVTILLVVNWFVDTGSVNPASILIFGALFGYYAPKFYLSMKIKKRQIIIMKSLPDVLDMMIICVEAGLGLNAALDRVARERTRVGRDVMGEELKYMTYELQAGVPREQAFHNLGARNGVEDLKALAAFMVQSEKLGGSLVEALKIYAKELRERRRQRAQEQANKAAVKLLFPLVFFIFPTMFIVILAPAVMQLTASMKDLH